MARATRTRRPASAGPTPQPSTMTEEQMIALAERALGFTQGDPASIFIFTGVTAETEFARGDAHMVSEKVISMMQVTVGSVTVATSRFEDAGLKRAVDEARALAEELKKKKLPPYMPAKAKTFGWRPDLFYETNLPAMLPDARAELFTKALDATDRAGLIGAGKISFSTFAQQTVSSEGFRIHKRKTYGELSLTARTKDGTGSGWAWDGSREWARIKPLTVIDRAIDLCERSAKPVALEPGRYTVILEPVALAQLVAGINWSAYFADQGVTPFSLDPEGNNKIGLQMLDRRIQVHIDPADPEIPDDTYDSKGDPTEKVVFFEDGVLKNLHYWKSYAEQKKKTPNNPPEEAGLRMYGTGPTQTLEEMIASTKRGIWVNRLSTVFALNGRTDLRTGTTRDGTFLIENGKITKAIKNFRFMESLFFVMNKLEAFGDPVRASAGSIVPRVKVRDFDFTSLTDAI